MAKTKNRAADTRNSQPSPQDVIFGMALSYLVSRCLHVAAELGIADLLKDVLTEASARL